MAGEHHIGTFIRAHRLSFTGKLHTYLQRRTIPASYASLIWKFGRSLDAEQLAQVIGLVVSLDRENPLEPITADDIEALECTGKISRDKTYWILRGLLFSKAEADLCLSNFALDCGPY